MFCILGKNNYIFFISVNYIHAPFKETKSATMNIFRKKNLFFLNHCKSRIKLYLISFHNKSVHCS